MTPDENEWLSQPGQREARRRMRLVIGVVLAVLALLVLGWAFDLFAPGV